MINFEYFDKNAIDTFTGHACMKGVYVESGLRKVYIGINSVCKIVDILKAHGAVVDCPLVNKKDQ